MLWRRTAGLSQSSESRRQLKDELNSACRSCDKGLRLSEKKRLQERVEALVRWRLW